MQMRIKIGVGFCLGLGIAACDPNLARRLNENHCANQTGDDWCAQRYGEGRAYCNRGCVTTDGQDGCVEARPVDDECYSPCGGQATVLEDAACLGGVSSTSESSTETGSGTESTGSSSESGSSESSTTGPVPCVGNEDCTEPGAPFCEPGSGQCVSCDGTANPDGACAELDPGLPLCVGGACVQCTAKQDEQCTGMTPVCDEGSNECVPCTGHEQCRDAACNLFTGACLPEDAVFHVGPGQTFETLNDAVMNVALGGEATLVVHQADYNEAVTLDGGRTVAFLAAEGELPVWALIAGNSPQLTVETGSTVLMEGLQLSSNANDLGVRVTGGQAWLDRTRVVQNAGGGILAEADAELVLRNCFVGGSVVDVDAIALNGSTMTMVYTTAGGGTVLGGRARALYCEAATIANVRNSILVSADTMPEVECAGATLTDSATEADVGNLNIMWFNGYATGDFSLTGMGATTFADVAEWSTGDPLVDIDGNPRPAVDGSPDYAGADVP